MANWFSSANASFLCVCSDGHTSIENIYSSECHQAEFEDYDNTATTQLRTQHDCEDTLLFSNSINSNFNHFNNIQIEYAHTINSFIKTNILSTIQDQSCSTTSLIQTDHRLKLFTDSVRLII